MNDMNEKVYEKLIRYASFPTASKEGADCSPSTEGQLVFARALERELKEIGMESVFLDENGYLYASVPASPGYEDVRMPGLIAHIDVSPAAPSENIKPRVILYEGGDITLENGLKIEESKFPDLAYYKGKHLVVTDGETLLGADDKAGVAEIVAFCERIIKNSSAHHGKISVAFTPDEEIGGGAALLDLDRFGAPFAYTLDGDRIGGVEYETFNAASGTASFNGVSVHPGSGKGKLVNAVRLAAEFVSRFPSDSLPETTEGYEGYFFADEISGDVEKAEVHFILRDHDENKLNIKMQKIEEIISEINREFGGEYCSVTMSRGYSNMSAVIEKYPFLLDNARLALERCGITPYSNPVRGGTDGASLSFRGLPCPNLGTGCGNFHGRLEYACVEDTEKMVDVLNELIGIFSNNSKD